MKRKLIRAAIVIGLGIATLSYGTFEKSITVRVDGRPVSVRTFATTVADTLDRAGVEVGERDVVVPSPETFVGEGAVIEVQRAKHITLLLDGRRRDVIVTGLTIEDVLREIELRTTLADRIRPSRRARVKPGMTIVLDRAVDVTVSHDDEKQQVVTNARTVERVIDELGIELGKRDIVEPALGKQPRPGMKIRILRVGIRTETEMVKVPYETYLRHDPDLQIGERRTVQEGVTGLKRLRYRAKYVDGAVVSRTLLSSSVLRQVQTRIIAVGSGSPGCACDVGTDTGEASWYSQADGLTAAHRTLPFGTVVRVVNLANGKEVNVTISDRGPYKDGRIIDLSDEAFRRIGSLSTGVIRVRIYW